MAPVHADGVHDPGHNTLVGAYVRGGDVLVGADEDADLGGVATGQVLEVTGG
jgi:hypothetical protein